MAYHRSRTCVPSGVSRFQHRIRLDRVGRLGSNVVFFAELFVELQSFLIRTRPEFPALVVTGSWAPLHTSRAGSSGYSAFSLALRLFTLIIVVGAFVSDSDFDINKRLITLPGRPPILPIYILHVISGFQLCCNVILRPLLLSPAHSLLGIPIRQCKRDPPFGRGLAARCARRDVLFLC